MEALQAIHPSQLSIGAHDRLGQLSIDSSGQYSMPGNSIHSPQQGNNNNSMTSIASPPYISSLMSEPCLFSGSSMEYGVIGQSEQPDTKDGLEELCPVCGDKVTESSSSSCPDILITIINPPSLHPCPVLKAIATNFKDIILPFSYRNTLSIANCSCLFYTLHKYLNTPFSVFITLHKK